MGELSIRINEKTEVLISPVVAGDMIEGPIYATNWFNLKRPWLYKAYAKLAYPHVVKAGGMVLFKGAVTEIVVSDEKLDREQVLIVRYPSQQKFLNMLTGKLFLMKSILRLKSVKDFAFGFAAREDNGAEPTSAIRHYTGNKKYMVHLFTSSNKTNINELSSLSKSEEGPEIFYFGKTAAHIARRDSSGKIAQSPFPIDGLVIWEAGDISELKGLLDSPEYQDYFKSNNTNGAYVVRRIL